MGEGGGVVLTKRSARAHTFRAGGELAATEEIRHQLIFA